MGDVPTRRRTRFWPLSAQNKVESAAGSRFHKTGEVPVCRPSSSMELGGFEPPTSWVRSRVWPARVGL
jgi:hypothetical protein